MYKMWDWDKGKHENYMCDRYTGCAGCKRSAGLNLYRAMGAIRHKDVVFLECCADVKRMRSENVCNVREQLLRRKYI